MFGYQFKEEAKDSGSQLIYLTKELSWLFLDVNGPFGETGIILNTFAKLNLA